MTVTIKKFRNFGFAGAPRRKAAMRAASTETGSLPIVIPSQIPDGERWLWRNPEALASVMRGRQQAAQGDTHYLGSFARYADLEIE